MEEAYATEIRIRFYDDDFDIKKLFNDLKNLKAKDYLELYRLMNQDLYEHQILNDYKIEEGE